MTKINDELFGELIYEKNFWRGNTNIQMFNENMEVVLSIDGHQNADFSPVQREAYQNFKKDIENIIEEVEEQIFEYYNDNFEEYREMLGNTSEADKLAPVISSVEELIKLVKPTELIVRRVRKNGKRRLGLLCDTSWDIEDGLGVKIENELVEEVGYQDIVL